MKWDALLVDNQKRESRPIYYIKLCFPLLLFPLLYCPYTLWWRRAFASLAAGAINGLGLSSLQLMLTGNNTILLFWCVVTAAVMLISLVVAAMRLRPLYVIPVYLAVIFSMCGILSLALYTAIIS